MCRSSMFDQFDEDHYIHSGWDLGKYFALSFVLRCTRLLSTVKVLILGMPVTYVTLNSKL